MNTEFDHILKEQLSQVKVTPSAGLTKTMGLKLFVQNVKVFHKLKAMFLIGSVTSIGAFAWYTNTQLETIGAENKMIADVPSITVANEFENNKITPSSKHTDEVVLDLNTVVSENSNKYVSTQGENTASKESPSGVTSKQNSTANNQRIAAGNQNVFNAIGAKGENVEKKKNQGNRNTIDFVAESNEKSLLVETSNLEYDEEQLCILSVREVDLVAADRLGTAPLTVQLPEFKKIKTIVKQFSMDAYGTVYGHSDIDNDIDNDRYSPYHWDFYKESEALAMQNGMGLDINYSVGTETIRFKMSTGINTTTIKDTKAVYKHYEITDSLMLEFLGLDDVSWVNTYGDDSCAWCMYAAHTDAFDAEMGTEYNRYSYVNIPLKVGGEIDFKYASFSAQIGMQYSQLTSAKGIGLTDRAMISKERFYYWNELQVKALQEENKMIRTNYLSFTGSAEARVRLTSKFDLMGGYTFVKSVDGITNDDYIVSKKLKYSQFKAGITYYPFRNELNPNF